MKTKKIPVCNLNLKYCTAYEEYRGTSKNHAFYRLIVDEVNRVLPSNGVGALGNSLCDRLMEVGMASKILLSRVKMY